MKSTTKKKNPRKPIEEENKPGKYDKRNKLNDLTGKEWLLLTKSFWETEPTVLDKSAYSHPAPFMIRDIEKLISLYTKKDMTVLDPFVGCGTTLIAASKLERRSIGIDINANYKQLTKSRLAELKLNGYKYYVGNSARKLDKIDNVDYVVTSPPYYNILKNDAKGIRHHNGKSYRMGAREGVEYYTDSKNDLANAKSYDDFIDLLKLVMQKVFLKLNENKYCTIIISDFTVNKKEVSVQGDIVSMMQKIGFSFCGTTVLFQPVKPLYPFGYPYAYKINHHHQNIITFLKKTDTTV